MSMKGNEGINGLFRDKLSRAEMPVRKDFWEELQQDLNAAGADRGKCFWLSPTVSRVAVAASVALVLGVASAAYWFLSVPEVREQAFTRTAAFIPETTLEGNHVEETFPAVLQAKPVAAVRGQQRQVTACQASTAGQQTVSVHFSVTVSQQVYGGNTNNRGASGYVQTGVENASTVNKEYREETVAAGKDREKAFSASPLKSRDWAVKPYIGTALPKGDFRMPFTAGVQVERRLNSRLALEAGLQYNLLHDVSVMGAGRTLHTLALPVKMNVLLVGNDKVDVYATAGGAVEKCVAGAADNSFRADPMQWSVSAGLGIRYKLTDRIALFAEPTVNHHFDTDSATRSLRTERPTNLNLLCGVRMLY